MTVDHTLEEKDKTAERPGRGTLLGRNYDRALW